MKARLVIFAVAAGCLLSSCGLFSPPRQPVATYNTSTWDHTTWQ